MRIFGKVCGNLIETKRKCGDKEEDIAYDKASNYDKYLQVDDLCKKLGWCESQKYVEALSCQGFNMNFEYEPSVSRLGRIVAEHTVSKDGLTDTVRLILFVKKVTIPLDEKNQSS